MRKAGVLLHISSLHGRFGIGTLGECAFSFIDFLSDAGFSAWQMLPINPIGDCNSPYQSPASFAVNPLFIDPDILVKRELISHNELPSVSDTNTVDYKCVADEWDRMLSLCISRSGDKNFIENEFMREWSDVSNYAHSKGIELIGDIPIYVAQGSAETEKYPEYFDFTLVSGCPPDAFCADGQRWDNPVYNWETIEASGYKFWIERMKKAFSFFDCVRLDHFRGFSEYWAIPKDAPSASCGSWLKGPGKKLFEALSCEFGKLNVIAEDLGYITNDVIELRDSLGFPGMAVLQFAFDSDPNPYRPENITENTVCYTGTHDNNTTLGWANEANYATDNAKKYFNVSTPGELLDAMIDACLNSKASLAVLPMQDLLREDASARMNMPGIAKGNWCYKMKSGSLTKELADEYRARLTKADRIKTPR